MSSRKERLPSRPARPAVRSGSRAAVSLPKSLVPAAPFPPSPGERGRREARVVKESRGRRERGGGSGENWTPGELGGSPSERRGLGAGVSVFAGVPS